MSIEAAIAMWLNAESSTFTALCGESFTRREVMNTGLATIAVIAAVILAGGEA